MAGPIITALRGRCSHSEKQEHSTKHCAMGSAEEGHTPQPGSSSEQVDEHFQLHLEGRGSQAPDREERRQEISQSGAHEGT